MFCMQTNINPFLLSLLLLMKPKVLEIRMENNNASLGVGDCSQQQFHALSMGCYRVADYLSE